MPRHARAPISALGQPRHGTIGWSATRSRRECASLWGAPVGGRTCLAAIRRTRIPTPQPAHPRCPPPPKKLPPRAPGLGAHHLLRDRYEAGLGEQHHVHPSLGNRVLVHAQGRDVSLRHAQWPRVGVHVPVA